MKTHPLLLALLFVTLPLHAAEPKGAWFICDFEQPDWQTRWNMGNPNLPRNLAIVPHRTTGSDPLSPTTTMTRAHDLPARPRKQIPSSRMTTATVCPPCSNTRPVATPAPAPRFPCDSTRAMAMVLSM